MANPTINSGSKGKEVLGLRHYSTIFLFVVTGSRFVLCYSSNQLFRSFVKKTNKQQAATS